MSEKSVAPGLYIVATPIGNLGDITLRGLAVLKQADVVACEDTRVTGKLLHHFGIKSRMVSYHEHNEQAKRPEILDLIAAGKIVALTSDAGTPLISDPGFKLVEEARKAGLPVFPVPGACAAVAALSASGLPTDSFVFVGFLPTKKGDREKKLAPFSSLPSTLVFYESANRLHSALEFLYEKLGDRRAVIAREITKLYETFMQGNLCELIEQFREKDVKGEIVILVSAPDKEDIIEIPLDEALGEALKDNSVKDAASLVARLLGLPRQQVYKRAVELNPKRKSG
jgi:16S rRNA (cytidine1402-2'-O)-methyltransferase